MRTFFRLTFLTSMGCVALQNAACGSNNFQNLAGGANSNLDANHTTNANNTRSHDPNCGEPAPTCIQPPANLVSWWRGDGNPNDSVGLNNGTFGGAYATGMVGQAFQFDATETYFTGPTGGLPVGTDPRTIELWVRVDSNYTTPGYQANIAGYGVYGESDAITCLALDPNPGNTLMYSQWGYRVADPQPFPIGSWMHIAVTVSTEASLLYVNGQVVSDATLPYSTPSSGTNFYIGGSPLGGTTVPKLLDGMVDEVSVYSRVLTTAEIQSIYNAGSAGKCTSH